MQKQSYTTSVFSVFTPNDTSLQLQQQQNCSIIARQTSMCNFPVVKPAKMILYAERCNTRTNFDCPSLLELSWRNRSPCCNGWSYTFGSCRGGTLSFSMRDGHHSLNYVSNILASNHYNLSEQSFPKQYSDTLYCVQDPGCGRSIIIRISFPNSGSLQLAFNTRLNHCDPFKQYSSEQYSGTLYSARDPGGFCSKIISLCTPNFGSLQPAGSWYDSFSCSGHGDSMAPATAGQTMHPGLTHKLNLEPGRHGAWS